MKLILFFLIYCIVCIDVTKDDFHLSISQKSSNPFDTHPISLDAEKFDDKNLLTYPYDINDPLNIMNTLIPPSIKNTEISEFKYKAISNAFMRNILREVKLFERYFLCREAVRAVIYKLHIGPEPEKILKEYKYLYGIVAQEIYLTLPELVEVSYIYNLLTGNTYDLAYEKAFRKYFDDIEFISHKNTLMDY